MKILIIKSILILFILSDLTYSFYQHYHMPLDGDMAEIIIPTPSVGYYQVLKNPFGIEVITKDEIYANPNRFFAHWIASSYFKSIPFVFQNFINPIDSVFLSCAIAKIFIQILILFVFSIFFFKNEKSIQY